MEVSFLRTGQAQRWLFTEKELASARRRANEDAVRALAERSGDKLLETLTPEEELRVVRRVLQVDLQTVAQRAARVTARVRRLAAVLVARLYLRRSILSLSVGGPFEPRVALGTALLVAAKAEEVKNLDTRVLGEILRVAPEAIVSLEPDLLAGIDFDLRVHMPQDCLEALLDVAEAATPGVVSGNSALRGDCLQHIDSVLVSSDALFTFSPQIIALGTLCMKGGTDVGATLHQACKARGVPVSDEKLAAFKAIQLCPHGITSPMGKALRQKIDASFRAAGVATAVREKAAKPQESKKQPAADNGQSEPPQKKARKAHATAA